MVFALEIIDSSTPSVPQLALLTFAARYRPPEPDEVSFVSPISILAGGPLEGWNNLTEHRAHGPRGASGSWRKSRPVCPWCGF